MSSETTNPAATEASKPLFNEKETKLLVVAMMSLKSGPPEIDMAKFMEGGEFNTLKTAQNTWGKMKQKLKILCPPPAEEEGDGTPATPSKKTAAGKPKATPASKKRGISEGPNEENDADRASPAKKPKTSRKKKDSMASAADDEAEEPSKGKKSPSKKSSSKKAAAKKAGLSEEAISEETMDDDAAAADDEDDGTADDDAVNIKREGGRDEDLA